MPTNPIDVTRPEEKRIAAAILTAMDRARKIDDAAIERAVRRGSVLPIHRSVPWLRFTSALGNLGPEIASCAEKGARTVEADRPAAVFEAVAKPILLDPELAELAANWARYHAGRLIREIDARSRANVRRLVRNASRRLARNPRGAVMDQLVAEIKEQIGLTSRQGSWLSRWIRRNIDGKTEAEFRKLKRAQIERLLDARARAIADREVAASFNEGVIRAARKAQKLDRLPSVAMKKAETVGDERVRARHQQQADFGPVALDQLFPLFSAQRPPWPGEPG